MSYSQDFYDITMLPFYQSHKARFWGSDKLCDLLCALVNLFEAIWVLLTFWRESGINWMLYSDEWLQSKLYFRKSNEELKKIIEQNKNIET